MVEIIFKIQILGHQAQNVIPSSEMQIHPFIIDIDLSRLFVPVENFLPVENIFYSDGRENTLVNGVYHRQPTFTVYRMDLQDAKSPRKLNMAPGKIYIVKQLKKPKQCQLH